MAEQHTSLLEALPLPKLEACYDAVHNRYWLKLENRWTTRISQDIKLELERLGYNTKAAKGKSGSEADYAMADIRNKHEVYYAGEVAGKAMGLYEIGGLPYLVTASPKLVVPKQGTWENIRKLGTRLFGEEQLEHVLGWSQSAVKTLYGEASFRSQMLVLAGPASCGKSFWQSRVVSGMLGGREADPIQYMTARTSFNEDIIRAEHLKMEDRHARTDLRARRALGIAVKEITANGTQRSHGKGKNAINLDSQHWITMSLNDEAENLSILPPMDESLKDKISLLRCSPAINKEWPGDGMNEWLEERIKEEIPAFVYYLFNDHVIRNALRHERFGIESYQDEEIMARLDSLSPEDGLDLIIDKCWAEKSKTAGAFIFEEAADIETTLHNHPDLSYRAKRILTWDGACGVYLERLAKKHPNKYVKPKTGQRPRKWTVQW